MGRRFGRNQKRRLKAQLKDLFDDNIEFIEKNRALRRERDMIKQEYEHLIIANNTLKDSFRVEVEPAEIGSFFNPNLHIQETCVMMEILPEIMMYKFNLFTENKFEEISMSAERISDNFCNQLKPLVKPLLTKHMVNFFSTKQRSNGERYHLSDAVKSMNNKPRNPNYGELEHPSKF